ncbi:MAG: DUF2652 domain-containing protein [Anaerolineales bacterium]|jgi:hypothetical protein
MASDLHQGYLVLADITGFTAYLSEAELDHANAILGELTERIIAHLTPLMILVEVEGDAVYGHLPAERVDRGETLVELFEATYVAFRDQVTGVRRRTTCDCNACRSLPMLDLKIICHYGDYALQTVANRSKPLGSDVNLAHRLLKNHVTMTTGWRAYILFTEPAFEKLDLPPAMFQRDVDDAQEFGEVVTYCLDLNARYQEIVAARKVVVEADQSDFSMEQEVDAPPPVVWEWMNDPVKRAMGTEMSFRPLPLTNGRMGPGAKNHCIHCKELAYILTIVDWRPFEYFTQEIEAAGRLGKAVIETVYFEPIGEKTRVITRARVLLRPRWFGKLFFKLYIKKELEEGADRLKTLIAQQVAA